MTGRHRWTRAGMKLEIDHLRSLTDRLERGRQTDSREIARLKAALTAWEARWANAHPVTVPAPRDLRPADDRPTVPTDVSKIRAVHRVVPITERPDAANPANIPAA